MGLFTQVIKKGAKVVDGLLDDAADAGKKAEFDRDGYLAIDPDPFPGKGRHTLTGNDLKSKQAWGVRVQRAKTRSQSNPERYDALGRQREDWKPPAKSFPESFNYERWLESDPEPSGSAGTNPEKSAWYGRRSKASERAGTDGHDDIGSKLPVNPMFDEAGYLAENPKPNHSSGEYNSWHSKFSTARSRAGADGFDELGAYIDPEPKWIGNFNYPEWLMENPEPPTRIGGARNSHDGEKNPDYRVWLQKKNRAERRANSEGYDTIGRAEAPETTVHTNYTDAKIRGMRTPTWVDRSGLLGMHDSRRLMEVDSGVIMEADHSTPLLGDYVSGLNIPRNIQIVPKDWHRTFGNKVGSGKNSLFYTPEANANMYADHLGYITENAEDIAYRQREKAKFVKGFSEQLSQDILSPHTKVGRNARKLWGDDTQKYLDYYKKELGLLGV